jgi:acyl-CoA synthetase (AMP-forming)/AMP-acid ligase II
MSVRSPFPDVSIPDVALVDFVLERAAEFGSRPALVDGPSGRSITYDQLAGAVRSVAAGLAERGFRKGDVMAIFSPNLPEYAVAFHAVARLGGISTTANPLYTEDELTFQLKDSGAKYLLTVPPFLETAADAAGRAGLAEVFVFGEAEGATPFSSLMSSGAPPEIEIDPREDVVVLPYSSGTTGYPKGVMLTHYNLVANVCQMNSVAPVGESDKLIGVLPFFHIYGMTVIMNAAIRRGATIVTMPRFDLEQFLQLLQDHKITRAHLVPPIVLALAKHPIVEKFDLSPLRHITSGAAPLSGDLSEACAARIDCQVVQGYGLTETSPVTHVVADRLDNRPGSIGPPIPNTECMVVDTASGREVEPGTPGEVLIRGPQVMRGYLNNEAATAATIDNDGWLHTGDIGYTDEDGFFFLVDRLKELIKYKGFQVAPAELEALLVAHPEVADAAVVGLPDPEAGEIPKAFVVKRGEVSEEEIVAFVADRVAPQKKIRAVEFVDQIPKSPSGKILRRVLKQREAGADH